MGTVRDQALLNFLLARIAEDRATAERWPDRADLGPDGHLWRDTRGHTIWVGRSRMLAECEAKRAIIAAGPSQCGDYDDRDQFSWKHYPDPEWGHCDGCSAAESCDYDWMRNLKHLASIYAQHDDYRAEWAA